MERLRSDLEAILMVDVPRCLRLALVVFALLLSHALGLAWMLAGAYEREAVRAEVQADYIELRNQVRNLWNSHEAMRTRRDRLEKRYGG